MYQALMQNIECEYCILLWRYDSLSDIVYFELRCLVHVFAYFLFVNHIHTCERTKDLSLHFAQRTLSLPGATASQGFLQ